MKLTLKVLLSEGFTEDIVRYMMKISEEQSPEWEELYSSMSDELIFEYFDIERKFKKEMLKEEYSNMSIRDKELKHLRGFQYAAHNYVGLSFEEKLLEEANTRINEKFTFFWNTESPFSQWYKCNFKGDRIYRTPQYLEGFNEEIIFSSTEQYMMYNKCLISLDFEAAEKVLSTRNPRKQKEIGRKIKMSEEVVRTWDFFKPQIVYEGNKAKFTQNKDLLNVLLGTKGSTLVESAPDDSIWGIGLHKDDLAANDRLTWKGKNLLGEILTKIRVEISGEY
ncbi:Riboflavin biosynthesis intermediates N-glycosidase [Tenacibaculum sp. 190524A05c]|uniref:NADAR family protein n=1 Tax=Tenacibaculum platacis TaxID=3137852 RepID=UPI0031FB255C